MPDAQKADTLIARIDEALIASDGPTRLHLLGEARAALVQQQADEALADARQQLVYWWNDTDRCPCGARRESPLMHGHVIGCPTEAALRAGEGRP